MIEILFSRLIFFIFLKLDNSFKLYLDLIESDKYSDVGILKGEITKNEYLFIKFRLFELNYTNKICENIGYDSVHSIALPFKLNESYSHGLDLKFSKGNCCQLFVFILEITISFLYIFILA